MRLKSRGKTPAAQSEPVAAQEPYAGESTDGSPRRSEARAGSASPGERAPSPAGEERRGFPTRRRRTRNAGAAAVGAVGSGVLALARLVMTAAALIALLIGLAIVLRDVNANPHNAIWEGIHEGANFFAGAFTGLITFKGHPERELTVDWGIALLAYLIVGALISRFIARIGRGGVRFEERHRAVTH